MKAEKDVLKLVKDLNRHEAEVKKLRQALCDRFRDEFDGCYIDEFDGCYIDDFFVVDEPQGDEQDDGEWCNQWTGFECDTGGGTYYYAVEFVAEENESFVKAWRKAGRRSK